jgi:superfamily II DNA or RNA helicase
MKQTDLDATAADCQVILATYAMANEGLNIKTLNAVVLASPRKRVEQSTGRILRMRPEERSVEPVIVDVVDPHDTYKRQWKLRLAYYKKCGYNIQDEGRPAFKETVIPANEHGCMLLGVCEGDEDSEEEEAEDE